MNEVLRKNYFELFDLPQVFDVDLRVLNQRYQALQLSVHPDRFVSEGEHQLLLATQITAYINQAFQALKDPLARARYLLELRGQWAVAEHETIKDEEFLMEQIELRQQLAEVHDGGDLDVLDELIEHVNEKTEHLLNELRTQLATNDDHSAIQAVESVRKLQFLYKIEEEADRLQD